MIRQFRFAAILTLLASAAVAQVNDHADRLGTVHFVTTCAPATAPIFDHAVALLHSFEFGQAIKSFNSVLAADSTCAMAQWGIAMSRWENPMINTNRAPGSLELGRQAAVAATRLGDKASERERGYINAVNQLYADYEHATQRARIVAYEKAMADVATKNLSDTEAMIFYAIALVASAPPTDKTYANQIRAGAMLQDLWAKQPDHPGLAHYIIHAYDVPALAPQAKLAAERYAEIAPSAPHALHMPSHIFTRIGMWKESISTNLRAIEAAKQDSSLGEALHASDYLVYAYLQMRRDSAAKAVIDGLPAIIAAYDMNAISGAANGAAGSFAMAAIPARYALERRQWREAASLTTRPSNYPHTEAITNFARALGAAHVGELGRARSAIEALDKNHERLVAAGESYWAEQVAIQLIEARATVDFAEGRQNDALTSMREAALREDATEKSVVTPGSLVPAHELLGDMLMDLKRPAAAAALGEYRESLKREPNRYRSLAGALKAARYAGDRAAAAEYQKQLDALTAT